MPTVNVNAAVERVVEYSEPVHPDTEIVTEVVVYDYPVGDEIVTLSADEHRRVTNSPDPVVGFDLVVTARDADHTEAEPEPDEEPQGEPGPPGEVGPVGAEQLPQPAPDAPQDFGPPVDPEPEVEVSEGEPEPEPQPLSDSDAADLQV